MASIETWVAESEGTNVERGWYFFIRSDAPGFPSPQARGPYATYQEAAIHLAKFHELIGLHRPLYAR